MPDKLQRRLVPGRRVELQVARGLGVRGDRACGLDPLGRCRVARVVVPNLDARARPLAARCARVELVPRCDLGVRHHLGPAGGLMLR